MPINHHVMLMSLLAEPSEAYICAHIASKMKHSVPPNACGTCGAGDIVPTLYLYSTTFCQKHCTFYSTTLSSYHHPLRFVL